MNENEPRGEFGRAQVEQLLRPVNPKRVVTGPHVKPHLSQQDVVAHLIRVFGFGHFDVEVIESKLLFEEPITNKGGSPAWNVGYLARVRLSVRDERQQLVAHYDGGSTGESDGQPSRADSHDLAFKSALSTATKRAAIHLGDQFGLSLYSKGSMAPLVMGTMVGVPRREDGDVQEGVEQQEEDGGAVADRQDAAAEASQAPAEPADRPAAARRATNGTQGTKRTTKRAAPVDKPAAPPEPAEEVPMAPPEDDAAEVAEREELARQAEEQMARELAKDNAETPAPEVTPESLAKLRGARAADAKDGETEQEYQQRKLREAKQAAAARELELAREAEARQAERIAQGRAVVGFPDVDGTVYASASELDAAIKARRNAEAAAQAATEPVTEEPIWADESQPVDAHELALSEELEREEPNWERLVQTSDTEDRLKHVYAVCTQRQQMTSAVRALVMSRKGELEA